MGSCWLTRNDYPDVLRLASQFETLIGSPEMVIGWFRPFRLVRMPEHIKENDPQPSRSIEADPDLRTRHAASSDVSEHKLADGTLRIIAEGTAAATGDEFFRSLARCAAQALGARYAFVAETLSEMESRSLAFWDGSDFGEGFTYRFPGTPCQRVAAGHKVLIAIPIILQVYLNAGLAYGLIKWLKVEHSVAAPGALIGASNFFDLAVATAIAFFGSQSGAALATVVGVLVEVPVMLSVCSACNHTRHWFPAGRVSQT